LRREVDFGAGGKIYSGEEANIFNHHNYLYKRRRTIRLASFDPP